MPPKAMAALIIANSLVFLADANRTIKSDIPNGTAKMIQPATGPSKTNLKTTMAATRATMRQLRNKFPPKLKSSICSLNL